MATIDILYFAWVREAVGRDAETVGVPEGVATIAELLDRLAAADAGHAAAFAEPARLRAALDQRFVDLDATLAGARELAIFPPVTGGMRDIRVQREPFDPGAELGRLEALGGGAVASFTGLVRGEGGLVALRLEHYPAMTERAMAEVAAEAEARWPLMGLVLVHRHGDLAPGERIVFVGAASPHRAAALEACAFLIDWLKTKAPFWKQERFGDGRTAWVEAKQADDAAAARWG